MAVKTVEIKNNTTTTITLKKDNLIKFSDMTENVSSSDIKLNKKGRNLIITSEKNGINLTIKKFFVSKKKDVSKLSVTLAGADSSMDLYSLKKSKLQWTLKPRVSKKTYYGTMWQDYIKYDSKYKNFYMYTGNDYISLSEKYNQKVHFGAGNKSVQINLGNKTSTLYFDKNSTVTFLNLQNFFKNIDGKFTNIFHKKNDLIFSTSSNYKAKGAHTVIVKDYFSKDGKYNMTAELYDYSLGEVRKSTELKEFLNSIDESFRTFELKKKGTLKGSFLNEILKGSVYSDKIFCVGGNNEVYADLGNDKIYCGDGVDKIVYFENDGTDKVYNATNSDILYMDTSEMTEFNKSGNNLVISHSNTEINGRDKIILVDYFKSADNRLTKVWNYDYGDHSIDDATYGYELTSKTITVNGTKKKETHNLAKGKYDIYLNGGKDTFILDKTATATINCTNENVIGLEKNGNDAIISYQTVVKMKKGKPVYKTGTMTVKNYFTTDLTKAGRAGSTIDLTGIDLKNNAGVSTLDFIKDSVASIKLTSSDLKEGDLYRIDSIVVPIPDNPLVTGTIPLDVRYYVAGSDKDERISINNKKNSMIDPRGGNDTVHAELGDTNKQTACICYSSGYDNYITGKGNDEFIIGATASSLTDYKKTSFNKNSKVHIRDINGSDKMQISAKSEDLTFVFNVNKNKKVVLDEQLNFSKNDNKYWDSLLIFNKNALNADNIIKNNFTGVIEIDNWFGDYSKGSETNLANYYTQGSGYIEKISTNNSSDYDIQHRLVMIAENVEMWLNSDKNTKNFDSAADVFNSGDKNLIASLIAAYKQ